MESLLLDESMELAAFLAAYPGLDARGLTLAVYERLCTLASRVKASQTHPVSDEMERAHSLEETNRSIVLEGWYPGVFPPKILE